MSGIHSNPRHFDPVGPHYILTLSNWGQSHNPIRAIRPLGTKHINTLRPISLIVTIIGTAKITHGNKIALITDVRKKLNTDIGDVIVFEENAKGQIVIKKG